MTSLAPDITDKIRNSFAQQSLMTTLGAELEQIDAGLVRISAPLLPGSLQQHGVAHAGVTFALGDSAAGYAALTRMAAEAEVVTAEMKINLLAPAQGPRLVAEGRIIRAGRRLTVVQADVFGGPDLTPVALLQGTMIPV